ncbi:hypothetical protein [Streptomyces globisporus]|uniref:hypothetical protein n=1 Tax=Streptomyces globisporus TaxID=1908 RepID=UPI0037AC34A5
MSEASTYEEDFWEEDSDDDWLTDTPITYREAVASLRTLVTQHADVQVDWNGRRGPDNDARVTFAGPTPLHVRLRSATQLADFTHLISSGIPLPNRHAVWYPQEQVIRARLIGDFDQVHNVLAQQVLPKARRAVNPDSALGRDLAGLLAEVGAFHASEPATSGGAPGRTMRLVAVPRELRLLYRARHGSGLSPVLELTQASARNREEAEQELASYGTSYLFSLGKATGASLRLWNTEYRMGSRRGPSHSGKVRFPTRRYASHPAELYGAGNSLARDPVERYLKYYQVLEYYMPKAVAAAVAAQGVARAALATSPLGRPRGSDRLDAERNALDAVIESAVTPQQLAHLLSDSDLFATISSSQIIQHVQALESDASGGLLAGYDYRSDLSLRVYGIRNRLVHMKEGGGPRGLPLLAPYSREARDLAADLRTVRYLAEHAMERWSTAL